MIIVYLRFNQRDECRIGVKLIPSSKLNELNFRLRGHPAFS